jgi:hypothetical protein
MSTTRCPSCETEYADALEHCPTCGTARPPVVHCTRCEQEYQGGDSCPACGLLAAEVPCVDHPDARAVARCVLCGRALCEKCERDGRGVALCGEHAKIPIIEGWAQVYSTTSDIEAQLLRENLVAEGIDTQVFSQKDKMFNLDLGELSIVRLLVPVWEFETALRTIREHMDAQGEVSFACSSCGEPFSSGERECAACGAALV